MSRDYKSLKLSTAGRSRSALIWGLFIGYTLGLISAIGVWMYLNQAKSPYQNQEKVLIQSNKNSVDTETLEPEQVKEKIAQQDEANSQFDFYEILPGIEEPSTTEVFEQAMQPPPDPISPENAPKEDRSLQIKPENTPEDYFLQAGSFKQADDAEDLKARLALLGMIASIQPVNLAEKGHWYRVRVGPLDAMSRVNQVRESLRQNGIETHFVKIRKNTR